ncbi:MAG: hypothetical protein L0332_22820 [Chloroflexi bacterium]|nr:hypothetical protein [Chloroflexota bacterium]
MLVIISDLHFEEEASNNIPGDDTHPPILFSRNLPGRVFAAFVAHLAAEAVRNGAKRLDMVLAGDVFDVHRTGLWFLNNPAGVRPYVHNDQVTGPLEALTLQIIEAIRQAKGVNKSLEVFQLLAAGKYWDGELKKFPVPVTLHYIAGNHDRLAGATPAIRRAVREALGLPASPAPFPRILLFPQEEVVIRHGHEYDRYNFALDYSDDEVIPLHVPEEGYEAAPFGDFATVDIASRLPALFRQHHGDARILASRTLRTIYLRLLEFDDLRPQSAIFNYLLYMPEEHLEPDVVWREIKPVIYELLEEVHDNPFLLEWLERMDRKWRLDAIDVVQTALALKLWRLTGIPLGLAQFVSNSILGAQKERPGVETFVAREEVIRSGQYRFVVAGHTHFPKTELLTSDEKGERYYIDTGTWRNRVPSTPDFKAFGRLKALTYVIIYGPDEDLGDPPQPNKTASLDFWSGVTQRWPHS